MKIKEIKLEDVEVVIDMLQDISLFSPPKSKIKHIYQNYLNQNNVNGYVFIKKNEIVGYGSIIYETKIRGGKVGHIEDIIVKKEHRGKSIGKIIIDYLIQNSIQKKCYKVSLVCKENNIGFYEKCGLAVDGFSMSKFF